jgi:hypothetical protein
LTRRSISHDDFCQLSAALCRFPAVFRHFRDFVEFFRRLRKLFLPREFCFAAAKSAKSLSFSRISPIFCETFYAIFALLARSVVAQLREIARVFRAERFGTAPALFGGDRAACGANKTCQGSTGYLASLKNNPSFGARHEQEQDHDVG